MDKNKEAPQYLDELTEEELGGGVELSSTGFLVFGLLSFWIYTVYAYQDILQKHFEMRQAHLKSMCVRYSKSESLKNIPDEIVKKGFNLKGNPTKACIFMYAFSMFIILTKVLQGSGLGFLDFTISRNLDVTVIGAASFMFCTASVWFVGWVCHSLKNHEYFEILLTKYIQNPLSFRLLPPSVKFNKRWNRNQNRVVLFLILCIPLTASPFIAIKHIYAAYDAGIELSNLFLIAWQIVLYAFASIFHIWGIHLLLEMYNGHLRIERFSRSIFSVRQPVPIIGNSVLEDSLNHRETNAGDLIPERSLAAIMLTDIVGFSKEMESDEEGMYERLLKHNEIIRKKIQKFNGREIKTIGDAFLVRFRSAVDAVRAAIDIQQALADFNRGKKDSGKILVRIGIHIGDVLLMDNDIIGNGVNIASRIEPLAEPGGICISADVYNIVKKSFNIQAINIGKKELKNIKDAPELYKILIDSVKQA